MVALRWPFFIYGILNIIYYFVNAFRTIMNNTRFISGHILSQPYYN